MIKPALTAEEWAAKTGGGFRQLPNGRLEYDYHGGYLVPEEARSGIAAIALYGQSFGFRREDVKTLHSFSRKILATSDEWALVRSLADRIEALLPPE